MIKTKNLQDILITKEGETDTFKSLSATLGMQIPKIMEKFNVYTIERLNEINGHNAFEQLAESFLNHKKYKKYCNLCTASKEELILAVAAKIEFFLLRRLYSPDAKNNSKFTYEEYEKVFGDVYVSKYDLINCFEVALERNETKNSTIKEERKEKKDMKKVKNLIEIIQGEIIDKNKKINAYISIDAALGNFAKKLIKYEKSENEIIKEIQDLDLIKLAEDFLSKKSHKKYCDCCSVSKNEFIEALAANIELRTIRLFWKEQISKKFTLKAFEIRFPDYNFRYEPYTTEHVISYGALPKNPELPKEPESTKIITPLLPPDPIFSTSELEELTSLAPTYVDFLEQKLKKIFISNPSPGSGKSTAYRLLLLDKELYGNTHNKKYYFYITDQKKDIRAEYLPFVELCEKYGVDPNAIYIKSNIDCIIDNKDNLDIIPAELHSQTLKKLRIFITNKFSNTEILKGFLDEDINRLESLFRKEIKRALLKNKDYRKLKTKEEKIEFIKNDPMFNWIPKIYTNFNIYGKGNIFINMDKFQLPCDTIIESIIFVNNEEFLKDSVAFIDEADEMKVKLVTSICNNNIGDVDILEQCTKIKNGLELCFYHYFHKDEAMLERFTNVFKLYEKTLPMPYKVIKLIDAQKKHWLFRTSKSEIIETNDEPYYIVPAKTGYYSVLQPKSALSESDQTKYKLYTTFVNELTILYSELIVLTKKLIDKLQEVEKTIDGEPCTKENAEASVINKFFGEQPQDKITKIVENLNNIASSRIADDNDDFYLNPGQFIKAEISNNNIISAQIRSYDLSTTPEKFLLNLIESGTYVILSSATARNLSVFKNFDLNWKRLNGHIYIQTPKAIALEKEYIMKRNKYAEDVNICFHPTEELEKNYDKIKELFTKKEINTFLNKLKAEGYGYREDDIIAYLADVYDCFCKNIFTGLGVFPFTPKLDDESAFAYIVNLFTQKINKKFKRQIHFLYLNADNIEKSTKKFQTLIYDQTKENSNSVYLLTATSTASKAVNLQFKCKINANKIVCINDYAKEHLKVDKDNICEIEMDLASLYVSKMTNVLPSIENKNDGTDNTNQVLEAILYLQALKMSNEITQEEYEKILKNILLREEYSFNSICKYGLSFMQKVLALYMQIIGRLCRTGYKLKDINITINKELINMFVGKNILDFLTEEDYEKQSYIMKIALDKLFDKKIVKTFKMTSLKRVNKGIVIVKEKFDNMRYCDKSNSEELAKMVKEYNDLCKNFKSLYVTNEEYSKLSSEMKNFYLILPQKAKEYSYEFEDRGKEKYITAIANVEKYYAKVNYDGLGLNDTQRNMLEKGGFSFEYKEGYILTPKGFEMLKGNIGEYLGKCIMNYFGWKTKEVPNVIYERVDEIVNIPGNTNCIIAADYKHFNEQEWEIDDYESNKKRFEKKVKDVNKHYGLNVILIEVNTRDIDSDEYEIKVNKCKYGAIVTIPKAYINEVPNAEIQRKILNIIGEF